MFDQGTHLHTLVARAKRTISNAAMCSIAQSSAMVGAELAPLRYVYVPFRVPYALGMRLQEHLVDRRARARAELRAANVYPFGPASPSDELKRAAEVAGTDIMLLLEHTPVYTLGRRSDLAASVLQDPKLSHGADLVQTKRGGLLTYHGPGQLVGYPILDLGAMNLSTRCYVARLQEGLRDLLESQHIGIPTKDSPNEDSKYTGVWVGDKDKIGSIGVQVRHRVTSHGFALNVENRALEGFRSIVACGLPDVHMTSIEEQLRVLGPDLRTSVPALAPLAADALSRRLGRTMRPLHPRAIEWVRDPQKDNVLKDARLDGISLAEIDS